MRVETLGRIKASGFPEIGVGSVAVRRGWIWIYGEIGKGWMRFSKLVRLLIDD